MEGGRRREKWEELSSIIRDKDIQIFGVAETHLRDDEMPDLPNDLNWLGVNRRRGAKKLGGVGFVYQADIKCELAKTCEDHEHLWLKVTFGSSKLLVAVVYMATGNDCTAWNEGIWACLTADIIDLNPTDGIPMCVMGDFNGHIHELDGREDANGRALKGFVDQHRLTLGSLQERCTGTVTWSARGQSTCIDYVCLNFGLEQKLIRMQIDEEGIISLGSDHNTILSEFLVHAPREQPYQPTQTHLRWRNAEPETLQDYAQGVDNHLGQLSDLSYDAFQKAITSTATRTIGVTSSNGKRHLHKRWFDKEVKLAIRERREANKLYRAQVRRGTASALVITQLWQSFVDSKHRVRNIVAAKIRDINQKTAESIRMAGPKAAKVFWSLFRKQQHSGDFASLTDNHGIRKTAPDDLIRIITDYELTTEASLMENHRNITLTDLTSSLPLVSHNLLDTITSYEVQKLLDSLPAGKAAGEDSITNELLRGLGSVARDALCVLLNEVLVSSVVPDSWSKVEVRLIFKGGDKDKADPQSYRPIALSQCINKLYMSLMKNRLEKFVEENHILGELQNGFRRDRRGADNLYVLTTLIEISRRECRPLFVAFLDLAKAYDSVCRAKLWITLVELGIPEDFVRHLRVLYDSLTYRFWFGANATEFLSSAAGLKQGCPLSPILFALYLQPLETRLRREKLGFGLQHPVRSDLNHCIPGMFFADDVFNVADNQADLQRMLDVSGDYASEYGLTFSPAKCKIVIFNNPKDEQIWSFVVQRQPIDIAHSFEYLGVVLVDDPNYLALHEQRLQRKSQTLMGAIKHKGIHSHDRYGVTRTLWKAVAVPSLTYGNEALTLSHDTIKGMERAQNNVGRAALGGNFISANASIKGEMGWSLFKEREASSKLQFLGRLRFMDRERVASQLYHYTNHMGTRTTWSSRVTFLDREFGAGFPRSDVSNYRDWQSTIASAVQQSSQRNWLREVARHTSLTVYSAKATPKTESFYHNDRASQLLYQARSGALLTTGRRAEIFGTPPDCIRCGHIMDSIEHVLMQCPAFSAIRSVPTSDGFPSLRDRLGLGVQVHNAIIENTKLILLQWAASNY